MHVGGAGQVLAVPPAVHAEPQGLVGVQVAIGVAFLGGGVCYC